jgi:hypothetical protein
MEATAGDIARELASKSRAVMVASGHTDCGMLDRARYVPESGAVVCGCGEFEPWAEQGQPAAWSPHDSDYADQDGSDAEGIDQQESGLWDRQGPQPSRLPGGQLMYEARDPIASALALIDPAEMYTPVDVERHILDTLYRLETGALFERDVVQAKYRTEQAFNRAFNLAVDESSESSADRRKASAMVKCDAEYVAMTEAKMLADVVKATMHNLRSILSGYQSTAKSVGAAYQAGGSQGGSQGGTPR